MATVLFLAPTDLGETVQATGALARVLGEGDSVLIAATPEAMPLFRAVPGASRLLIRDDLAAYWRVVSRLVASSFDVVIDARGGVLGGLPRARQRFALKPAAVLRHRVEEWADALGAERALAPVLWLDEMARAAVNTIAPDATPLLVLAPGGNSASKRWPPERFGAVARRLATGALSGARVAIVGAAQRDVEISRAIAVSLDADEVPAIDLGASLDLLSAAALMERATLCIGNDNALTHLAAAAGAPTLTLFGPTDERVRAPYGPRTRTLRGRSFEAALDARDAMEDVSVDAVEAAALDLLHAGGLR